MTLLPMNGGDPDTGIPIQPNNHLSSVPFIWGPGGARLTPEQVLAQRELANQQMQSDFSPVGSVWEGLGRVANNVFGALDARSLDKQDTANQAESDALLQAIIGGDKDAVTAGLTSPYAAPQVRKFAEMQWERNNPKPQAPTEFERTLRGAGIDPQGEQGISLYAQRANTMASPQPQFVSDGMGGGRWVTPPMGQIQGGGGPASPMGAPAAPVGKLTPIQMGGPSQSAAGGFR